MRVGNLLTFDIKTDFRLKRALTLPGSRKYEKNIAIQRYSRQKYSDKAIATAYQSPKENHIQLTDEGQAITLEEITERPSLYVKIIRPYNNTVTIVKNRYHRDHPNYQLPSKMTMKMNDNQEMFYSHPNHFPQEYSSELGFSPVAQHGSVACSGNGYSSVDQRQRFKFQPSEQSLTKENNIKILEFPTDYKLAEEKRIVSNRGAFQFKQNDVDYLNFEPASSIWYQNASNSFQIKEPPKIIINEPITFSERGNIGKNIFLNNDVSQEEMRENEEIIDMGQNRMSDHDFTKSLTPDEQEEAKKESTKETNLDKPSEEGTGNEISGGSRSNYKQHLNTISEESSMQTSYIHEHPNFIIGSQEGEMPEIADFNKNQEEEEQKIKPEEKEIHQQEEVIVPEISLDVRSFEERKEPFRSFQDKEEVLIEEVISPSHEVIQEPKPKIAKCPGLCIDKKLLEQYASDLSLGGPQCSFSSPRTVETLKPQNRYFRQFTLTTKDPEILDNFFQTEETKAQLINETQLLAFKQDLDIKMEADCLVIKTQDGEEKGKFQGEVEGSEESSDEEVFIIWLQAINLIKHSEFLIWINGPQKLSIVNYISMVCTEIPRFWGKRKKNGHGLFTKASHDMLKIAGIGYFEGRLSLHVAVYDQETGQWNTAERRLSALALTGSFS